MLLQETLAPHPNQMAVLPGQLRLALLQGELQPAPLCLHLQAQQVQRDVCLHVLGMKTAFQQQIHESREIMNS